MISNDVMPDVALSGYSTRSDPCPLVRIERHTRAVIDLLTGLPLDYPSITFLYFTMLSIVRSAVPSLRHFQKDLRVLALHGCGNPSAIRCILAVGLRIFHDDLLRLLSRYNAPTLRCVASTVAKYPCGKGGTNRAEHYCVLLRTASGGAEWLQRMNTGATPLNVFDLPSKLRTLATKRTCCAWLKRGAISPTKPKIRALSGKIECEFIWRQVPDRAFHTRHRGEYSFLPVEPVECKPGTCSSIQHGSQRELHHVPERLIEPP